MSDVVDMGEVRTRVRAQKAEQAYVRIRERFQGHEDYGIILNLLEEYGPTTTLKVLKETYGVDLLP